MLSKGVSGRGWQFSFSQVSTVLKGRLFDGLKGEEGAFLIFLKVVKTWLCALRQK